MSSIQILYIHTFSQVFIQYLPKSRYEYLYEICIFFNEHITNYFSFVVVIVVLIIIGFSLVLLLFSEKPCHNDEFTIISIV